MHFEIPIEDTRGKRSYILLLHLAVCFLLIITGVMEFLLYVFFAKTAGDKFHYFHLLKWGGPMTFILGIALLGLLIVKNRWFGNHPMNRVIRIIELILFSGFAFIAWKLQVTYPAAMFAIIAGCLFFAIFWEAPTGERKVIINEKGILLPKANGNLSLNWYEIEQVILRYGIITIDCLDNRLLQWNIKSISFDEASFHEFCKAKIAASIKDRGKNW
ncbi:MAG TPA: hypothetical protein PLQ78_05190 [Flavipsychrobacter sp.]|nr:hypothetical protein [Flavipsychrobacter sp.]